MVSALSTSLLHWSPPSQPPTWIHCRGVLEGKLSMEINSNHEIINGASVQELLLSNS